MTQVSCLLTALAAIVAALTSPASSAQPARRAKVSAEIVVAGDAEVPTLMFRVTNVGTTDVEREGFLLGGNRLVVLTPSGHTGVIATIADDFGATKREVIRPGETVTWEKKVAELDCLNDDAIAGTYRVYFEYTGVRSNEVLVRRSAPRPARANDRQIAQAEPLSDHSTPKSALKMLLRGLDCGHLPAVTGALRASQEDEAQRRVHGLLVRRAMATGTFASHAEHKFGKAAERAALKLEASEDTLRAIDTATVAYPPYFDTASLDVLGRPYRVVRDGNEWLVSASSVFGNDERRIADFARRTDAIRETADEISRDEYKTLEDAMRRLRQRLDPKPTA